MAFNLAQLKKISLQQNNFWHKAIHDQKSKFYERSHKLHILIYYFSLSLTSTIFFWLLSDCVWQSVSLSCSASLTSLSEAVSSDVLERKFSLSGNSVTFRQVDLLVNGVQMPWTLGLSVCHIFRNLTMSTPDRERRCPIHSQSSSFGLLAAFR